MHRSRPRKVWPADAIRDYPPPGGEPLWIVPENQRCFPSARADRKSPLTPYFNLPGTRKNIARSLGAIQSGSPPGGGNEYVSPTWRLCEPSGKPNHAAFLDRRVASEERRLASDVFFAFTSVSGFTNSSKLGQMVARPQWAQSGFWE